MLSAKDQLLAQWKQEAQLVGPGAPLITAAVHLQLAIADTCTLQGVHNKQPASGQECFCFIH
jgi:hypothetical protein